MGPVRLVIIVSLALGAYSQTDEPTTTPMPTDGTPIIGGCLANLTTTIASNPNDKSPRLVVKQRRSSRQFPEPGIESSSPDGKPVFSNESRRVVVMNLTQMEAEEMVSYLIPMIL